MTKKEAIDKVVNAAAGELGYKALAGRENKYAEYLDSITNYYNGKKNSKGWGAEWCDIFVDYMFLKTFGNPTGRLMIYQPEKSLGAGCRFSADYYIQNKAWTTTPERGMQGFIGKRGSESHTGIVESVSGNKVTMIEGNAGGGNGMVKRNTWLISDFSGFGIPDYSRVVNNKETTDTTTNQRIDSIALILSTKAKEVMQGKYGNGSTRVKRLGEYYDPVQWIINRALKGE